MIASIEEFAERYSLPKPFIGLILVPIVVSEVNTNTCSPVKLIILSIQALVTPIWLAMKSRMELTISICVGKSIVSIFFKQTNLNFAYNSLCE